MKQHWIKERISIDEHTKCISGFEFSSNDTKIITAGYDGTILLSDLTRRKVIHKYKLSVPVKAVAVSDTGKKLLAFTDDKLVHIWDISSHKKKSEFPVVGARAEYKQGTLGYKYITVAAFSPDRKHIALGCQDKNIYIVPTVPRSRTERLAGHKTPVFNIGWIDNDLIFSSDQTENRLAIWSLNKHKAIVNIPCKPFLSIAAHGTKLATASIMSRKINIWDPITGDHIKTLRTGFLLSGVVESICFHPDGFHIAAGMNTGMLKLLDIENGKSYTFKNAHAGAIDRIQFSKTGKYLVSSDRESYTVKAWKINV